MKNYKFPGDHITLPAPYDVTAGDGVKVGAIFGVSQGAALAGEDVVLVRKGGFDLVKTSAQAWTRGAKIYWDDANRRCTTAASGNSLVGAASSVAADPSDIGEVLLDGVIR